MTDERKLKEAADALFYNSREPEPSRAEWKDRNNPTTEESMFYNRNGDKQKIV